MKPKNIFLIRHGESEGNINKQIYKFKPDYALRLTPEGIKQAHFAGNELKNILNNEKLAIYYSSFFRTMETLDNILEYIPRASLNKYYIKEEPRLREQEWSGGLTDYDPDQEEARDNFGHFYYRFNKGGESCADVYDRISSFLDTLNRDFQKEDFPENCLIVTHGMTMRVFLMRFFHVSVEEFELWKNPKNCELWKLELQNNNKYSFPSSQIKYHTLKHNNQYKFKNL